LLALRAQEKGLELVGLIDPEVPRALCGDPGRLRQILVNLIGNSIKFTSEGEVSVQVSLDADGADGDDAAKLRFEVRDTGIGIPADRVADLFEAFTQVDASTTRKFGGTGLGLAICKRLVELMDGEIGVRSVEGEGSTFWFAVVLDKREATISLPELDLSGSRILAVDDSAINRRLLETLLEAWRCRHAEVAGAEAALTALRAAAAEDDPFTVALIDMHMPDVDGEMLGERIKADADIRDTRLVMMTSMGERGDATRLGEKEFSGYLTKPVKRAVLRECLATVQAEGRRPTSERERIITRHTATESLRRRARILLAEDNPVNQRVATVMLEKLGYRVDAVANGREAVVALGSIPYHLVLMDCEMPELDGFGATREIRDPSSAVKNHDVPIIAMTASALEGDRDKCIEAGMDDYLAKPVELDLLREIIAKWLEDEDPVDGKGPVRGQEG